MDQKKTASDLPTRFEVEIEKLVYGGEGLSRFQGKVIFVPFAAPGDLLEVRPVEQKKGYARAVATRIIKPGPGRATPPCPHFLSCGGCQWQHLEYEHQVQAKRKILEELFHHRFPETAGVQIVMKASPDFYGYRTRARMQARGSGSQGVLGFYQYGSHSVEDIAACPLFVPALNDALAQLRVARAASESRAARELEIAVGTDGDWAVAGAQDSGSEEQKDITLFQRAGSFEYATSPSEFFQANGSMLDALIDAVLEAAGSGQSALDLYAGVGFFSLPLARRYQEVISIESNPRAHRLCIANSRHAGLDQIKPRCAEAGEWMRATAAVAAPSFGCVLLDPPRNGADAAVMRLLAEWVPDNIVYVSCDPQTLVRDLALLPVRDYRIAQITGLDLFPQTYHFETVVHLMRRT